MHNEIFNPDEGTTLHWHGIRQQGTEWMDGVPTVSMCPIVPGGSYTYRFRANVYGTTWYHSHYSSQYVDGLWGALIINGPTNKDYDTDLGPVALTDYYHRDYFTILKEVMGTDGTKFRPASDNNLINGKNFKYTGSNSTGSNSTGFNSTGSNTTYNSTAGLAKFQFTSGKKHRLRLINTGTAGIQKFSIDNHTLTVIANDFIPVEPYDTNVVTLGVSDLLNLGFKLFITLRLVNGQMSLSRQSTSQQMYSGYALPSVKENAPSQQTNLMHLPSYIMKKPTQMLFLALTQKLKLIPVVLVIMTPCPSQCLLTRSHLSVLPPQPQWK